MGTVLHCVLIILSILFVFGQVSLKSSVKNQENEYYLKNKKNIEKGVKIAEIFNDYKNNGGISKKEDVKNAIDSIVLLIDTIKRIVETKKANKYTKKDGGKMLADNDVVLIYDTNNGRLTGRSGLKYFIRDLSGTFKIIINYNKEGTMNFGHDYDSYEYY